MNTQTLQVSDIRIDGGTQPRVEMNEEVIVDYAEQMRNGITFPPVTVFFDGAAHWLADGFHRYHAHRRIGRDTILADVQDGGLRDAILHSVGTNTEHGLRRTNGDKHKAVNTMLTNKIVSKDEDGVPLSDHDIAKLCHVHHTTVGRIRKELSSAMHQIESSDRLVKRGNSTYLQNTAKIGKTQKRKKFGGIARDAFKPVRACEKFESRAAIELPYNPVYAANAIISTMGAELAIQIANQILTTTKGN